MLKRWRAGSLTMGLVLITSGALIMVSLISGKNLFNLLIALWPIILISLGIEIILHLLLKKDEDSKIKYDVLGVIFISVILLFSTMFYALSMAAGMFDNKDDFMAAVGILNRTAYYEEEKVFDKAEELVLYDDYYDITLIPSSDDKIKAVISVSARTSDTPYAEELLKSLIKAEDGQRASLFASENLFGTDFRVGYPSISIVIYLPQGKTVDASQINSAWLRYDSTLEKQIKKA